MVDGDRITKRCRTASIVRHACEVLEPRQLLSRPEVLSSMFDADTSPHKVIVQFDQNVGASLVAGDLRVEPVTSTDQAPLATALAYDAATNTATFSFAGLLPEANYRAVLASEDVSNAAGETLAADHVRDFWFLLADVSGNSNVPDRLVGIKDHDRLTANMGKNPATYSEGDFNYDGRVNLADFNILSTKFGSTMPAPPAGPGETTVRTVTSSSVETNWIDNVTGELGWRVQWSFDGQNFDHYTNLGADTEVFLHSGLPDGTRIWYRTRAYGNGQDTAYTPKVATTTSLPATGEAMVSHLDDGRYEIAWADNSQNESGFLVTITDGSGQTQEFTVGPNDGGEGSLILEDLNVDGSFTVTVVPLGAPSSPRISAEYSTRIQAPRKLEAKVRSSSWVDLRWRDRSTNEVGFRIQRDYLNHAPGWAEVGLVTLNVEKWSNIGLGPNEPIAYRVFAYGAQGRSLYSKTVYVTTPSLGTPEQPGWPDEPTPPQGQAGQTGEWLWHGESVSISPTENRISLGTPGLLESDVMWPHVRSASLPLGQDVSRSVVIDYDLSTWDEAGWDTFGVSITDVPYHQLQQPTPTYVGPAAAMLFEWGGQTDAAMETASGTTTINIPADAAGKWLNFTLGDNHWANNESPSNLGMHDTWYPSWGTFRLYTADLDVDSNNDGVIDDADAAVEDEVPGVIIPVNDDDDDNDGTPDMEQTGTVPGEDDLVELKLSVFPPDASGTVSLSVPSGSDKVRLYASADRSTPLTLTSWAAGQQPSSVWAEAIAPGSVPGELQFALALQPAGTGQTTTDSTSGSPTSVDLRWKDAAVHDKKAGDVIVGQKVHLQVATQPAMGITNLQWEIEGARIKSYTLTSGKGEVKDLTQPDLQLRDAQFYWIDGGTDVEASVSFLVAGKAFDRKTRFDVLRPSASLTSVTTANNPPVDVGDNGFPGQGFSLHFGTLASPGIRWTGTVTAPAGGAGEIAFTQLINMNRTLTLDDAASTVLKATSHDTYVLDGPIQYGVGGVAIAEGATQQIAEDDSPNTLLVNDLKGATADDQFRLYLMYRPDGVDSIWVSLRLLTWHWKGAATKGAAGWAPSPGSSSSVNPGSNDSMATPLLGFGLPEWIQNVEQIPLI